MERITQEMLKALIGSLESTKYPENVCKKIFKYRTIVSFEENENDRLEYDRWLDQSSFNTGGPAIRVDRVERKIPYDAWQYNLAAILRDMNKAAFVLPQRDLNPKDTIEVDLTGCDQDLAGYVRTNGVDQELIDDLKLLMKNDNLHINDLNLRDIFKLLDVVNLKEMYESLSSISKYKTLIYEANNNVDPARKLLDNYEAELQQMLPQFEQLSGNRKQAFIEKLLKCVESSRAPLKREDFQRVLPVLSINQKVALFNNELVPFSYKEMVYESDPEYVSPARYQREQESVLKAAEKRQREKDEMAKKANEVGEKWRKISEEHRISRRIIPNPLKQFFNNKQINWDALSDEECEFNFLVGYKTCAEGKTTKFGGWTSANAKKFKELKSKLGVKTEELFIDEAVQAGVATVGMVQKFGKK